MIHKYHDAISIWDHHNDSVLTHTAEEWVAFRAEAIAAQRHHAAASAEIERLRREIAELSGRPPLSTR